MKPARSLILAAWFAFSCSYTARGQEHVINGPFADEAAYERAKYANSTYIGSDEAIGLVRAVELLVDDQAEDGCWTNADAVKAKARAELERSSIAAYEEPLAFHTRFWPTLTIRVLGTRAKASGGCFGSMNMTVTFTVKDELGSLSATGHIFRSYETAVAWSRDVVWISQHDLNKQALEASEQFMDELIADVLAGRRSTNAKLILQVFPEGKPITQAEYEAASNGKN